MNTKRLVNVCASVFLLGLMGVWAADEIRATAILKIANGEFDLTRSANNQTFDQTGTSMDYHIQSVGTAAQEQVTVISDVSSNGWAWFRNITTNTDRSVDVGAQVVNGASTNFVPFIRLLASEFCILRLHPTSNIWAKANVGAVNLEAWINEF